MQKGHTYYRCTKKGKITGRWCGQPYVREEVLDEEVSRLLSPFVMRADVADAMLARLETERKLTTQASGRATATKHAEIESVRARLQRLQDGFLDGVVERQDFVVEKAKLMSQKKTLEEQSSSISRGGKCWLEPMRDWVLRAKNVHRITTSGSRAEKKALAKEIFGSNLFLDSKKACGRAVNPWAFLADNELSSQMVEVAGVEPACP
ncbi:MAG TPA: zinc ribbon domain-containing protein [Opitutus sp.]|nr:zinc ribbon domain-containing protein [Opitutus sp.]